MDIKDFKKGDKVICVETYRSANYVRDLIVVSVGKKYLKCSIDGNENRYLYLFQNIENPIGNYCLESKESIEKTLLFKNRDDYNSYLEFIELRKWFCREVQHYSHIITKEQILAVKEILENTYK